MNSDQSKALYAAMCAEAEAKGLLRARARQDSSLAPDDPRKFHDPGKALGRASSANLEAVAERLIKRGIQMSEADHLRVNRDPCFCCQVPFDKHGEFGCRRWQGTAR
jgi:hypothetical protein